MWKDARVWAHWSHSFDVHLSYWDQNPVFSHPQFPQAAPLVVATVWWLLDAWHSLFPSWIPSGLTVKGGCNCWWLTFFIYWYGRQYFISHCPIPFNNLFLWYSGWGIIIFFSLTSVSFTASSFLSCAPQELSSWADMSLGTLQWAGPQFLLLPVYNWVSIFFQLPKCQCSLGAQSIALHSPSL